MEDRRDNRSWKRPERRDRDFKQDEGFRRESSDRREFRPRRERYFEFDDREEASSRQARQGKRPRIQRESYNQENQRDFVPVERTRQRRNRGGNQRQFDRREHSFDQREDNFGRERKRNHSKFESNNKRSFERKRQYYSETPDIANKESGLIRLNKYISNSGICSRREADVLISTGVVTVNGEVVTQMGYKVKPGDSVCYGGEKLSNERKVYLLLNKPKGFITTLEDPQERKTVMNLVGKACKERIYPVGRLDRNTCGLLLFTNDGELTKKLTHPSFGARKIYHVELDKPLTKADMNLLCEGVELEDGIARFDDIQYVEGFNSKKVVGVELHSGKNRIVRRMFNHLDYKVEKLDRVFFAGLTKKNLTRGHYRFLTEQEVAFLKK